MYIYIQIKTYQSPSTILPESIVSHKTDKHDVNILLSRTVTVTGPSYLTGTTGLLLLLEEAVEVP